ncbi:MAG: tryptophan 2,3-dioxygenase family protein [Pseudonocardia sp.]|nr:tryptophan 2,3-dioxygenase family protein [Pseudonocardia sp.]
MSVTISIDPPTTDPPTTDPALRRELDRWSAAPADGLRLARLVTCQVRRHGKHRLGVPLLAALAGIRDRHGDADTFLAAFLDSVLDRHEDRFRNQTYLALPLLGLILADRSSGLDPHRLSALLVADLLAHEAPVAGTEPGEADVRRKRIRHATTLLAAVSPAHLGDPPAPPPTPAGAWLALTVLPVSVVHDEYFFLRCLQIHELVFTVLTEGLRDATRAVRCRRVGDAVAHVRRARTVFHRAALLFRIVATMRPAQFHDFRRFTDGASAIQSEAYKRFEIACGDPAAERIASEAFSNVPVVLAEARHGDSLARATADLRRDGGAAGPDLDRLTAEVELVETAHHRWRTTHHRLAVRMLGDAPGSGHTAGVPYLRQCLGNRLFTPAG